MFDSSLNTQNIMLNTVLEDDANQLVAAYKHLDGPDLLDAMLLHTFPGRIALVSSFGAEAAVLLAMAADIDPTVPVIFLETGKHFDETLDYVETLSRHLGLTDVRLERPEPAGLKVHDPDGDLWRRNNDACCHVRKVLPLENALSGFDAWITGRKRFQTSDRKMIEAVEFEDGRYKVNPLIHWSLDDVRSEFQRRGLPRHPLAEKGFLSIGCAPCTQAVGDDGDYRAGRWQDQEKTECGIHGRW